jgi:hypothetical protein
MQFQAGYLFQDTPGFVIYAIMPTQVTGIVIGNFLAILAGDLKPSLIQQLE